MYLSGKELASIKCLNDTWHRVNLLATIFPGVALRGQTFGTMGS